MPFLNQSLVTHMGVGVTLATALVAGTANAGTISVGFQQTVASEEYDAISGAFGPSTPGRYYHVSVNPNNAGYASYIAVDSDNSTVIAPFSREFSDPVVGWSFYGGTKNTLGISEESGGLISYTTTDTVFDAFGQNQIRFWNATDPGADFNLPLNAADVATRTHDKNVSGYRSFGNIQGTIDVSGLASGTANIFYGAFSATPEVSAILRDTDGGAPDMVLADLHLNGDVATRTEFYVAEVDFTTAGGYDTIIYDYVQPGAGNGRAGGIVLTGVPEPGSLALIALGGLVMIKRRRRA